MNEENMQTNHKIMTKGVSISRRAFLGMAAMGATAIAMAGCATGSKKSAGQGAAATGSAPEGKPNIVLILSDDHGIDGVGCYGSDRFKGKTPNLDALAKSGLRFERCYSTPLCGPTRCEIMTGRYPFRTGGCSSC